MPIILALAIVFAATVGILRITSPAVSASDIKGRPAEQIKVIAAATTTVMLEDGFDLLDVQSTWFSEANLKRIEARAGSPVDSRYVFSVLDPAPVTTGSVCKVPTVVVMQQNGPTKAAVKSNGLADDVTVAGASNWALASIKNRRIAHCGAYEAMVRNAARAFERRAQARMLINPNRETGQINFLDYFDEVKGTMPSLSGTAVGGVMRLAPSTYGPSVDMASLLGVSVSELQQNSTAGAVSVFGVAAAPVAGEPFKLQLFVNPPWVVQTVTHDPAVMSSDSFTVTAIQPLQ